MKGAIAGALVGAAFFLAVFGLPIVRPTNIGWLMRHDSQTYYLAFEHFRHEPWQWPPGAILGVGHPVGTSIGNTDAVPLVSFPLKVLHPLLPEPFQFLGLWLLSCYVLQGVFGALLARQVTSDLAQQTLASALFVLAPALLNRIGHAALCAHWTFLAAVWLLLAHDLPRGTRVRRWLLLTAVTAAVQPYLAVIVLGLGLCVVVNGVLALPCARSAVRALSEGAALVLAAVAVFWLCGYFLIGTGNLGREGFGSYSMNLLSPVIPLRSGWLLPAVPMVSPDQYEGLVYFGAGWLALALVAMAGRVARHRALPPLGLAWLGVAGATLLAVSPIVTFGSHVVADLSAWSPPQMAMFRSSGRFGWLPMYLAFAAILRVVVAWLPRRAATSLLALALALQLIDGWPAYAALYARERSPAWTSYASPLSSPAWDAITHHYGHVVMVPPDMCVAVWPDPVAPHLAFSMLAAHHGATVNSGNAGRYDAAAVVRYCASLQADVRAGRLTDDSLYVLSQAMRAALAAATPPAPVVCSVVDGFDVCVTAASYDVWREAGARAGFAAAPLERQPPPR